MAVTDEADPSSVDPALDNADVIAASYPMAPPGLFTPTGQALDWAFDNMVLPEILDHDRPPQLVILATDGEPNSCDNQKTDYATPLAAANKGHAMGVKMHVISLAAAAGAFHDHLQQLAPSSKALDAVVPPVGNHH